MFIFKSKHQKIVGALNKRINDLKVDRTVLSLKIKTRDLKIKDQMEGLQHLNHDLDQWEPLSDLIASFPTDDGPIPITIPQKGIKLLNKAFPKQ